jgi:hypothetical protein
MGIIHRIFNAEPDELSRIVDEIRDYQRKTEEALTKELQQAKQKQTTTINILRNNK